MSQLHRKWSKELSDKASTSSCMKKAIVVTARLCLSFPPSIPKDCQWVPMMCPFSIFTHLLWAQHPLSHRHRIVTHRPIHTLSLLLLPPTTNHHFCGSTRIWCKSNAWNHVFFSRSNSSRGLDNCCISFSINNIHLAMVPISNVPLFLGQLVWHNR